MNKKWLGSILMGIGSLMIVFWVFMLCLWFPYVRYVVLLIGILMVIVGRSLRKRGLAFRLLAHFMTKPHYPTTEAYADNCDDIFLPCGNILEIDKRNGREKKTGEQKKNNECNKQNSNIFDNTAQAIHIEHIVKQFIGRFQPRDSRTVEVEH